MSELHILIVSQYFYPEPFRINDIAAEWVRRGYKVTVLTGIPNYPQGEFYEGYDRKHNRQETWNGMEIVRVPIIARGHNALKLAANYFSFVSAGKRWVKKHNIHADIVFTFEVSPMTQALVGTYYGKKYQVPTMLYVQDLWPENVVTVAGIHNRLIVGWIDRMVDKIYRETDMILTTSPSFVEAIVNRKCAVPREKVHYWPQYAEDFYRPMEPVEKSDVPGAETIIGSDAFKIAFTGNIGKAQGLEILPKTAELLKNENIKFVIVGDGRYKEEFESEIDKHGVRDQIILIPRQPAEKIPEILSLCDACFLSFANDPLWEKTIPAKLQSYLACGKPIIASASGETERLISEANCGMCTKMGDSGALAKGITELLSANITEWGKNARTYFTSHFCKEKVLDEVCLQLEELVKAVSPERQTVQ